MKNKYQNVLKMKEKNESKLHYYMSHELRTPVNLMLITSDVSLKNFVIILLLKNG